MNTQNIIQKKWNKFGRKCSAKWIFWDRHWEKLLCGWYSILKFFIKLCHFKFLFFYIFCVIYKCMWVFIEKVGICWYGNTARIYDGNNTSFEHGTFAIQKTKPNKKKLNFARHYCDRGNIFFPCYNNVMIYS